MRAAPGRGARGSSRWRPARRRHRPRPSPGWPSGSLWRRARRRGALRAGRCRWTRSCRTAGQRGGQRTRLAADRCARGTRPAELERRGLWGSLHLGRGGPRTSPSRYSSCSAKFCTRQGQRQWQPARGPAACGMQAPRPGSSGRGQKGREGRTRMSASVCARAAKARQPRSATTAKVCTPAHHSVRPAAAGSALTGAG